MNENLGSIMDQLEVCTRNYTAAQIVGELEIVVERLGFARLDGSAAPTSEHLQQQVAFLLDRDVSPGMLTFVSYLGQSGNIGVLLNDAGQMFLAYTQTHYKAMRQVMCKTAIMLNEALQQRLRLELLKGFPPQTRLIFVADPNIIYGFVLQDGTQKIVDQSLRARTMPLVEEYIRQRGKVMAS